MKNRALKISVSIPLKIVEELDQLTTYKGRSRSKWITNAITERLKGFEAAPEMSERQLTAMLFNSTKRSLHRILKTVFLLQKTHLWKLQGMINY